ncbi:MAG TPA: MnhB domain-containing protein [Sulfurovum sp.]|uniref:MnhB domain-containing protein n=1 Tax=Sulfurovum sp. TaxID=1969726 RepID=UPI002F95DE52
MKRKFLHTLIYSGALLVFMLLCGTLLSLETFDPVIDQQITAHLQDSGVSHEVTAVLLNFRALDTLLEVGVVLLALIAIYTLDPHFRHRPHSSENTITNTFVALLFPLIVLCSFYLLYSGSYQSGGAFAAAALLAGGIIIVRLVKPGYLSELQELSLRFVYVSGLLFFVGVGTGTLFLGAFLEYRNTMATFLIVSIETVLTVSLGVILATYFINAVQRFK